MAITAEFLILGQGLAGTCLAWELLWRGRDVLVVDAGDPVTSSKIAAGLVTPITGQRMALSWRIEDMLPAACRFYDRIVTDLGAPFLHPRLVRRIFRSAAEVDLWDLRRHEPARLPFIAQPHCPDAGEFGGFEMHGAHLDCAGFLAASRSAFERRGCLHQARFDSTEAADFPARRVIFCQGFAASRNPFFSWIQWNAAKGEILTVRSSALDPHRILSAGQWLVPIAADLARTGSTYDWHHLDTNPTSAGRALLESGLRSLHPQPAEVLAHHAAVRPIIRESKALIGIHPANDRLAFFNGLGSKGALLAPFYANQLADHLVDQTPLEPDCDLRRNR